MAPPAQAVYYKWWRDWISSYTVTYVDCTNHSVRLTVITALLAETEIQFGARIKIIPHYTIGQSYNYDSLISFQTFQAQVLPRSSELATLNGQLVDLPQKGHPNSMSLQKRQQRFKQVHGSSHMPRRAIAIQMQKCAYVCEAQGQKLIDFAAAISTRIKLSKCRPQVDDVAFVWSKVLSVIASCTSLNESPESQIISMRYIRCFDPGISYTTAGRSLAYLYFVLYSAELILMDEHLEYIAMCEHLLPARSIGSLLDNGKNSVELLQDNRVYGDGFLCLLCWFITQYSSLAAQAQQGVVTTIIWSPVVSVEAFDCKYLDMVRDAVIVTVSLQQSTLMELAIDYLPHCISATNISHNALHRIGENIIPSHLLGVYFFSPVHIMPLLVMARTELIYAQVIRDFLSIRICCLREPRSWGLLYLGASAICIGCFDIGSDFMKQHQRPTREIQATTEHYKHCIFYRTFFVRVPGVVDVLGVLAREHLLVMYPITKAMSTASARWIFILQGGQVQIIASDISDKGITFICVFEEHSYRSFLSFIHGPTPSSVINLPQFPSDNVPTSLSMLMKAETSSCSYVLHSFGTLTGQGSVLDIYSNSFLSQQLTFKYHIAMASCKGWE